MKQGCDESVMSKRVQCQQKPLRRWNVYWYLHVISKNIIIIKIQSHPHQTHTHQLSSLQIIMIIIIACRSQGAGPRYLTHHFCIFCILKVNKPKPSWTSSLQTNNTNIWTTRSKTIMTKKRAGIERFHFYMGLVLVTFSS